MDWTEHAFVREDGYWQRIRVIGRPAKQVFEAKNRPSASRPNGSMSKQNTGPGEPVLKLKASDRQDRVVLW
jgi:hypothetical protein